MSWAQVAPRYMTALAARQQNRRALTLEKPFQQNFYATTLVGASLLAMVFNDNEGCLTRRGVAAFFASMLAPTRFMAYLPDLILVQLRVRIRWVAAGKSAIAYSLASTSAGG
ncbi:hypothetical protein PS639_03935 [Pseudomonas fluorescens]|nr:hypothetical protein PS639_03935 [Pseudomonas fluorescens]